MADELTRLENEIELLEEDLEANPVPPPAWLRTGAPIDTAVFWYQREFTVTGHRWTSEGCYVLALDDNGLVTIPYLDATDDQGMVIYEEYEFEAPEVITKGDDKLTDTDRVPFQMQEPLLSRGEPLAGMDADEVAQIAGDFIDGLAEGLRGWEFEVGATPEETFGTESVRQLPELAAAKGATFPRSRRVGLVGALLHNAEDVTRTLRHEILGHVGLIALGETRKKEILAKIKQSRHIPSMRPIWRKIDKAYHDKGIDVRAEEVFAYLAEHEVPPGARRWWQEVEQLVVDGLRKVGLFKGRITASEIRAEVAAIAEGMRRGELRAAQPQNVDPLLSRSEQTADENTPEAESGPWPRRDEAVAARSVSRP